MGEFLNNLGKELNSGIKAAESTFTNTEKSIASVFTPLHL
jgi:hypothetical protein